MKRFFLLLVALLCFSGCGKKEPVTLVFYCDETFMEVMREEARLFRRLYGVRVVLLPILPRAPKIEPTKAPETTGTPQRTSPTPWRSKPQIRFSVSEQYLSLDPIVAGLIDSLGNTRTADLYLSDSPEQMDRLRSLALASHEYPICYLDMVLLVARESPHRITSLREALEKRLRVGIVAPSKSGMGSTAWNVITKMPDALAKDFAGESVVLFDFQDELLAALKSGEIDAALVWDSLIQRTNDFADPIRFDVDRDDSNAGSDGRTALQILVSLNTAVEEGYGRRFADFIISDKGREILRKHGFAPKPR